MTPSPVSCALCGGGSFRPLPKESRLIRIPPPARLLRCRGCGLTRRDPLSLPEETAVHYDESYYRRHGAIGAPVPASLQAALRRVEERVRPGRLLEIGCGLGYFLDHARRGGWEPSGVDASPWAAGFARTTLGLDVREAPDGALPYPDGAFRAIFAHHVLEHLPAPVDTLRELLRVAEKGAVLVVVVPNEVDHLFFRIGSLFSGAEGHGFLQDLRRCLADHATNARCPSSHLFFFNPETLQATVQKAGWQPSWKRTWRGEQARSRYPGATWLKQLLYALEARSGRGPLIELAARKAT